VTEKKADKTVDNKDYEAMVKARVQARAVSLGQMLSESVKKSDSEPNTDKKIVTQKVYLEEKEVKKKMK
jgi:hypothetical protein